MKYLRTTIGIVLGITVCVTASNQITFGAGKSLSPSQQQICNGVQTVPGAGSNCTTSPGSPTLNGVIAAVVNILSAAIGILAIIMIMFAGFRYVNAGGDSGKISSAKDTIIYAIVGLVVAGFAQAIVRLVLHKSGIG
ncbi:MAG TPA: pilin [Candidatus Saccharimonadales bacterium]|nr:pilin [Candidatus Saccharimonadales bacterium]